MDLSFKEWNEEKYQKFINYLKTIQDKKYQQFQKKIINTKYEILGVRLPIIRKIVKKITNPQSFLQFCQNKYYEEVLIKGLVITSLDNFEPYLEDYLLEIDNWAICDSFCNSLKIKDLDKFLLKITNYLSSKYEYTVRVGLVLLLNNYVSEKYLKTIFSLTDKINRDEYYINMAISWLIAECFIKYPNLTWPYIKNNHLNKFTQNKIISKIRDSYRVKKEVKEKLLEYRNVSMTKK